ncbi:autotransporter assembly complex protein TamB [Ferrimonas pelagia]|uniref:Autotransporter assembly complex protein TamB n=1 Tax=Ferrimonas pelagia TaxID=1177826 RepID=A0ABP9EHV5_9GAMM
MTLRAQLRKIGLLLASVPLVLLVLLALLLGTPLGTHLLLATVDAIAPPLSLSYRGGTLNRGLALHHFALHLDNVTVEVDEAEFQWKLHCLLQARICAEQLDAAAVRVYVTLEDDTRPPASPPPARPKGQYAGIPLPLSIVVQQADLRQIDVRIDLMHYQADRIRSGVELTPVLLALQQPQLESARIIIPLSDGADSEEWPLASLPEVQLPFEILLEGAQISDSHVLIGDQHHHIEALATHGRWHHTQLSLTSFDARHNWANAQGHFSIDFIDDYPMAAALQGQLKQLPWLPQLHEQPLSAQISGGFRQLDVAIDSAQQQQGQLLARLDLSQPALPYQAQIQANQLHWPLQGEPQWTLKDLSAHSQGSLHQQRFTLNGQLQGATQEPIQLLMIGEHGDQRLTLHHANLMSNQGEAQLNGSLDYQQGYAWQAQIRANQLDLSEQLPELGLQLDGALQTQGAWRGEQWQLAITDADLQGQIWGYPLKAQGTGQLDQQWHGFADQVTLALNGTELELDGGLVMDQGRSFWRMDGQIRSDQIQQWQPELSGNAELSVRLRGPEHDPELSLRGVAEALGYQQLSSNRLNVRGRYKPRQSHQFELTLTTPSLHYDDTPLGSLHLRANGDHQAQRLSLALDGDTQLDLALDGELQPQQQRWLGHWTQAEFTWPQWQFALQQPATLALDLNALELVIGQHCWLGRGTELCLNGPALIGQRGAMAAELNADPASLLKPWLPKRLKPKADLTGTASISWQPGELPWLQMGLSNNGGEMQLHRGPGLPRSQLQWQQLQAQLRLSKSGLQFYNQTILEPGRGWDTQLTLASTPPYALSGSLTSQGLDLSPYLAWFTDLSDATGVLDGKLDFAGTLRQPQILGELTLSQGKLRSIHNPTELDDIQINAHFQQDHGTLRGRSKMGDGQAQLEGQFRWQQGLEAQIHLTGERLQVLYPPIMMLEATPDLHLSLTPERIGIEGDLRLTQGSFTLESLPEGAVEVSQDVVFVDTQVQKPDTLNTRTEMDLRIQLDNVIDIEALGLSGTLGGDVTVRQGLGQPLQAFGELTLSQGRFRAFGQRLQINRGQFSFNGPPELPNLDVEASREIEADDVTAGVRLTGTPATPQLTLFSSPAMEQQEILSYLTRGQGLNASEGGSSLFTSAALSLGVGTTGGLITTIGEGLGFNDVIVDTEGAGDETQITISAFVGKRLYIKYGVGVFDSINELTVRYNLLQRLWLEAVSAITDTTEQSLDLYYSFDID